MIIEFIDNFSAVFPDLRMLNIQIIQVKIFTNDFQIHKELYF
jgi:hypothetical protein